MGSNQKIFQLLREAKIRAARSNFWEYRTLINPKMKRGWWQEEVARQLQLFYEDYISGKRPKLVIQAPPQHGKSIQIIDFISWIAGKHPELKSIYTSFSERLGVRANLQLERRYRSDIYQEVFPALQISQGRSDNLLNNSEIVEYSEGGFFRNTTVRGSITGESLDLGIIDDPIKGRADANSETVRNAAWDWFTDDFFTRFSEDAGLLCILTRWHVDDPIGRLIAAHEDVKELSYPAIAVEDDEFRKKGDPLFPEHKSLDFLLERKKLLPPANFESLYQQNPYVKGGELFKEQYWNYWSNPEELELITSKYIYADTAMKTKESNDWSVFQCWGKTYTGKVILLDQIRGKWEAPELLVHARSFYQKHQNSFGCFCAAMKVEDKASGTGLIQTLQREGIPIVGIQRNTDKVSRANDVVHLVESGNVYLPKNAEWLSDYLTELSQFPNAAHDDQVDPTIDALADMLGGDMIDYGELL